MQDFRELRVWEKAVVLGEGVYAALGEFPHSERFALIDQLKRAAGSVPANSAEACSRRTPTDFRRFLRQALGSLNETESHLELARRVSVLSPARCSLFAKVVEVRKMPTTLIVRAQTPGR